MRLYESKFTAGWELPDLCNDLSISLRLLVDSRFPFTHPHVAVFPPPPTLTLPNMEEQGLLCLFPEGALTSVERLEEVVMELLQDAQDLVNGWAAGTSLERFEDEFQSYWIRWPRNKQQFVSLCATGGESRWVYAFFERNFTIVADDEHTLKSWVANYFTPNSKVSIQTMPLVKLPCPPRPEKYPSSVGDLFALINDEQAALTMLQTHISSNPDKTKGVLLAFTGRRGFGFAGLILPRNDKKLENGFRKGHTPPHILMHRYLAYSITGGTVFRCDPSWVHGRDHNPDVFTFGKKTVVLLGAGSLGSGVAELLAKIGVGKLILIDPEFMAAENASRHSLGIRSMFRNKASDLALNLSKRFPHLQFESYCDEWEQCYQKQPSIIASADLVISTIGVWTAESSLNALVHDSKEFPPILFGWLEEHAAAGHAATFVKGNGCLRCLTDDLGRPRNPVTKWPDGGTQRQIPMCGGMFQPYGATELNFAQSLVADLASDILLNRIDTSTHRVWIGQKKVLDLEKGEWHPSWIARNGDPEIGGRLVDLTITNDPYCPICGEPQ